MASTKPRQWRAALSERDGWSCHYCGVSLIPDGEVGDENSVWHEGYTSWDHCSCGLHSAQGGDLPMPCVQHGFWSPKPGFDWPQVDHKVPRCHGGTDLLGNLVLSCGSCNNWKGSKPYEDFIGMGV
jgi:hypothetical protein